MDMSIDDMSTETIERYLETRKKKGDRPPFNVGDFLLHKSPLHHDFKEEVCVCTKINDDGTISHQHLFAYSKNEFDPCEDFKILDVQERAIDFIKGEELW